MAIAPTGKNIFVEEDVWAYTNTTRMSIQNTNVK